MHSSRWKRSCALCALAVLGVFPLLASAQGRGSFVERRDGDIKATGLSPLFPPGTACEPIASPFASAVRYDGSPRRTERFGGLHGGIDISVPERTPLVAVAPGAVLAKGEGGMLEGFFLWLAHTPADTGLPMWIYTKYQHLYELPALKEGERVRAGQPIALSGKTGTEGGVYGAAGYPHLHFSAAAGPSAEYERSGMYQSVIRPKGGQLSDPLLLYLTGLKDAASLAALPEESKRVRVAVVGSDGTIYPAGSKTVWPVPCRLP